jgi:hypothetical protein
MSSHQMLLRNVGVHELLLGEVLPSDVPNLIFWYKSDSLSLNDDDPVTTWADQSGWGRDITGPAPDITGVAPIFKTNILNGKPAVRWNGSNTSAEIAYLIPHYDPPYAVFVIAKQSSKATNGIMLRGYGDDHLHMGLDATTGYYRSGRAELDIVDATDHSGAFHNFCHAPMISNAISPNPYTVAYVDGVKVASGSVQYNQLSTPLVGCGPTEVLTGDIVEIFGYGVNTGSRLSEWHRQGLEIYIYNRYWLSAPPARETLPVMDGLVFWLRAMANDLPDDALLDSWDDSTAGMRLTPSNSATFKTVVMNGKPVVRFNDTTHQWFTRAGMGISQPNTIMVLAKVTSGSATGRILDSTGLDRQFVNVNSSGFLIYAGGYVSDAVNHTGAFHVFTAEFNGASSKAYVDGIQVATGNSGTNGLDQIYIGSDGNTATCNGDISDIAIFNGILSTEDRQANEAYLKTKAGI